MKNNIRKKLYIIILILVASLIPTKYVYSDSRDINWYNSSYTRIYPKLVKTYNLSKGKEDINRSSFGLQGSKYDFYNYGMQAMTVTDKYIVFALVYNPNNSNSDTIQNKKNLE